ncbi:hypothetical protein CKO22_10360 [Thiococcus pfennigii]|nr:hypothetical protein [Thiococcus pfennigii]
MRVWPCRHQNGPELRPLAVREGENKFIRRGIVSGAVVRIVPIREGALSSQHEIAVLAGSLALGQEMGEV